ncbi:hypothetical protein HW555_005637 [Spodoptera exigua]|uniref:Uncharacterized protein n=1 Tax=Spodoptera exigua TaxID=7107 RepID=A0A835GK70_SPOEX|nr:hypothetical protein HW555_005637 [Spodoptera exigua]
MRLLVFSILFSFVFLVSCKSHVKSLNESMGQEVIEVVNPIKELPMGLDEEPASEKADKIKTRESQPPKGEYKRISTISGKENMKDIDKIDGVTTENEEDRIEKELAEIYKDTADYKNENVDEDVAKEVTIDRHTQETTAKEFKTKYDAETKNDSYEDTDETTLKPTAVEDEQANAPIRRRGNNFKLQPDSTDKDDIERFRTSVDDINCNENQMLSKVAPDYRDDEESYANSQNIYANSRSSSGEAFNTVASRQLIFISVLFKYFLYISL